jgi:hypothetical protein
MNETPLSRLSGAYLTSLRAHWAQGAAVGPEAACEIGREAVALGLETLDLARIHAHALTQLLASDESAASRADLIARATAFFTEAITPIEETHRAALKAAVGLEQQRVVLDQLTAELAEANDELQRQVEERCAVESTLRHSQKSSSQLLKASRVLEQQLQDMTHKVLAATEGERREMSLQLNDGIAQTLLGVHLRILALNKEVAAKQADLGEEIAATRQVVANAAKIISSLTHEFSL